MAPAAVLQKAHPHGRSPHTEPPLQFCFCLQIKSNLKFPEFVFGVFIRVFAGPSPVPSLRLGHECKHGRLTPWGDVGPQINATISSSISTLVCLRACSVSWGSWLPAIGDIPGYPRVTSSHAILENALRGCVGGIGCCPPTSLALMLRTLRAACGSWSRACRPSAHRHTSVGLALRVGFRHSFVIHFHYGLAVLNRLLPTPPHGDAVSVTRELAPKQVRSNLD